MGPRRRAAVAVEGGMVLGGSGVMVLALASDSGSVKVVVAPSVQGWAPPPQSQYHNRHAPSSSSSNSSSNSSSSNSSSSCGSG